MIPQQLGHIGRQVNTGVKYSLSSLFLFLLRLFSGVVVGLVFAIAIDEMINVAAFAFYFIVSSITLIVLYVSRRWGFVGIGIFDLLCVLTALLLRFYIVVAPGA